MIPTIIIGAVIAAYAAFVIVRKVKRIRKGQFCDCSCGNCQSKCGGKERK